MSGSDDPLAGLLGAARRPKPRDADLSFGRSEKSATTVGLNPLDILALPAAQRDAINWLSRRKQATLDELHEALKKPLSEVAEVLEKLKVAGYVREALVEGRLVYRVVFGGKASRSGRGMPANIWNAVDLDNRVFLQQLPLFAHLSPAETQTIAAEFEPRHYRRNEVIAWQGTVEKDILFVKNGIVGLTRLLPNSSDETRILSYLKSGDLVGEINLLLDQNVASDATATALSEVDVLAISRVTLAAYLKQNRRAALELARLILNRLLATNARLVSAGDDTRLAVVFGIGETSGQTMLGSALTMTLAQVTQSPAVYTEHPDSARLLQRFDMQPNGPYYRHKGAFDIAIIKTTGGLPPTVRGTFVMDQLVADYTNVVIGVPGKVDDSSSYMLEQANQLVIVFSPEAEWIPTLEALVHQLHTILHPEKTNLFVVANHTRPGLSLDRLPIRVDFEIPYYGHNQEPVNAVTLDQLPAPVRKVTDILANRLGRTNQIGVYIPSVVDDPQLEPADFVQETLSFLGGLFGGATASSAETQATTPGDEDAVEQETIHIVRTYVTKVDLDRYLSKVLEYLEHLKVRMGQETLALEVNNKLMLI